MNSIIKRAGICIVALLIFFTINVSHTNAQGVIEDVTDQNTELGFKLSPSIVILDLNAGDTISFILSVEHQLDIPVPIRTQVVEFIRTREADLSGSLGDASKWIEPDVESTIVTPGEVDQVLFNISVPSDTVSGSYFATPVFQPLLPDDFFKLESVHLIPHIGGVVVINVEGSEERLGETADIEEFVHQSSDDTTDQLLSKLNNTDTYFKELEGEIIVYDIFNNIVDTVEVDSFRLLPTERREVLSKLSIGLRPGVYRAQLLLVDGNDLLSESTTFFVNEVFLVGLFVVTIVSLYLIIYGINQRYKFDFGSK